jgi:hypothetical protein
LDPRRFLSWLYAQGMISHTCLLTVIWFLRFHLGPLFDLVFSTTGWGVLKTGERQGCSLPAL